MNTKLIFAVSAAVTFVAGIVGTHIVSKNVGRKEAINTLRNEQLAQASDEYKERHLALRKDLNGNLADIKYSYSDVESWYAEECRVINEMYEDIINNLP